MPRFRYTAIDRSGARSHGIVEAVSEAAVADRLYDDGRRLLNAAELGIGGRILDLLQTDLDLNRGLPKPVLARLTRELAVMMRAGQDIDRALQFLLQVNTGKREQAILGGLRDQVRAGKSLAAALAEQPRIFSRLYISMVRAGEAGGTLQATLTHLADLLEREARLSAGIRSAMTYPALLVLAAVGTVTLLLTTVLPQFVPIFDQAGAQLPAATRFLIDTGAVVRNDGIFILIGLAAFLVAVARSLHEPAARKAIEQALLRVPLVGTLIKRAQAARLTRTLGTLLQNGVSLVSALGIAQGVLGVRVAVEVVAGAAQQVKAGARLANSLAAGRFFPAETVQFLELGEEAGNLGEMALHAADIHDDQVHQSIQRLVAMMVPIITIVMGAIVAGIVGSLLVAMMSINDLAS